MAVQAEGGRYAGNRRTHFYPRHVYRMDADTHMDALAGLFFRLWRMGGIILAQARDGQPRHGQVAYDRLPGQQPQW